MCWPPCSHGQLNKSWKPSVGVPKQGMDRARAEGKHIGRPKVLDQASIAATHRLHRGGVSKSEIADVSEGVQDYRAASSEHLGVHAAPSPSQTPT